MQRDEPRRHWTMRVAILAPYAWLVAFFLLPFLIVLKISLSQTTIAQPPYVPVLDLAFTFASTAPPLVPECHSRRRLDHSSLSVDGGVTSHRHHRQRLEPVALAMPPAPG